MDDGWPCNARGPADPRPSPPRPTPIPRQTDAPRPATSGAPARGQTHRDHHFAATPVSHPDCRAPLIQIDAPQTWFTAYAANRYGGVDPHAFAAWDILARTAFAIKTSAPQDSLFDAQPTLDTKSASAASPQGMGYDAGTFARAGCELLDVAPRLRDTSAYRFDLVNVTRQVISNRARVLLPQIRAAYAAKDAAHLNQLTQTWLDDMRLLNRLLASNRHFLLGTWLAPARAAGVGNAQELARLEYDQRSLITVWGPRRAADQGRLHDYANRQLAGLVSGYYLPRWQRFFASIEQSLATGKPPAPIDWYALGHAWATSNAPASTTPRGDGWPLAREALTTCGR
ncbi:MAG TPA: alpha-N-acetylglucosaminidase C-terminal domain-containing protein [Rhodanobacteraceae bacterium]